MFDQAADLRQLVLHRAHTTADDAPTMIVVSSGKGGVGATTLAINLAIGLARDGRRTALVDADLSGGDVATLCGLDDAYSVTDVLSGSRTVHEALQLGPAGILVLGGAWHNGRVEDVSESAVARLIGQLQGLRPHIDYVVLDTGSHASRAVGQFWQAADTVLLATSPELVSIMDTYSLVKQWSLEASQTRLASLVNLVADAETVDDVHDRLSRACRRFLGLDVVRGGWVPSDVSVAASNAACRPLLLNQPTSEAARQIEQLAESLAAHVLLRDRAVSASLAIAS